MYIARESIQMLLRANMYIATFKILFHIQNFVQALLTETL